MARRCSTSTRRTTRRARSTRSRPVRFRYSRTDCTPEYWPARKNTQGTSRQCQPPRVERGRRAMQQSAVELCGRGYSEEKDPIVFYELGDHRVLVDQLRRELLES